MRRHKVAKPNQLLTSILYAYFHKLIRKKPKDVVHAIEALCALATPPGKASDPALVDNYLKKLSGPSALRDLRQVLESGQGMVSRM